MNVAAVAATRMFHAMNLGVVGDAVNGREKPSESSAPTRRTLR